MYVFSVTCKNILLYGCNALNISRHNIIELDKLQAKLIKNILGIHASHRSTLLLKALNIQKISDTVAYNTLVLFKNIISSNSAAKIFNMYLFTNKIVCPGSLYNRVVKICQLHDIDILKLMCDSAYLKKLKSNFFPITKDGVDGAVDSVRTLLKNGCTGDNLRLLKLLLKAY